MAATTATLVKAALRIPTGVTFFDVRLGTCASAANAYVLGQLRQDSLAVLTETEYPDVYGPAQRRIVLRRRPVVGIVAVTVDNAAVASTAYRVDTKHGFLIRTDGQYWSDEPDGTQVHYGAGYDAASVPNDLVEASTLIAAGLFNRGGLSGLDQQDDGATQVRVSADKVPPEARAILSRYRDLFA